MWFIPPIIPSIQVIENEVTNLRWAQLPQEWPLNLGLADLPRKDVPVSLKAFVEAEMASKLLSGCGSFIARKVTQSQHTSMSPELNDAHTYGRIDGIRVTGSKNQAADLATHDNGEARDGG
jgi:hypothetical protein